MFDKIDIIVNEIKQTDEFKKFVSSTNNLNNKEIFLLLSKHSIIQEDYFNSKKYSQYIDNSEIEEKYKEVKRELMNNQYIIDYYESYYKINELLENVTSLLFDNISDELILDSISIGSKLWE